MPPSLLAEAALYIACACKSNSACLAIDAALADIREGRTLPVPEHLRDAHYAGAQSLGHGQGYQYAHDHPGHFVVQDYIGAVRRYYSATAQGHERKIKERLEQWRARITQAQPGPGTP
jgi:putative ATPase